LIPKTRNFNEKAASKKKHQKLENTSNQYFFEQTLKKETSSQQSKDSTKGMKEFSNQYFSPDSDSYRGSYWVPLQCAIVVC